MSVSTEFSVTVFFIIVKTPNPARGSIVRSAAQGGCLCPREPRYSNARQEAADSHRQVDMSKLWLVVPAHQTWHFPAHGLVVMLCSNFSQRWVKVHCLLAFSNRNQWGACGKGGAEHSGVLCSISIRCVKPVLRCPHPHQCPRAVAGEGAHMPADPHVLQRWQRHEKVKRLQ